FLLNQQKDEPTMFVQPLINVDSNRLCGIFWMTASQIILWSRYSDVILHDNTSRTNKYNYPLSLFILVDNEGKSRLVAQAFLKARNSLCIDVFEQRFQALLEKYPNAYDYLQSTIYSTRQSWACSFINRIFTAGMQSTQRVESINALIHKVVASSSSMTDVIE